MVERFNAVARRGNLDFEAWFNERTAADRSWDVEESSWRFRHRYLPAIRIGRWHFRFPLLLLNRNPPDVLVSLYAEPSFVVGWVIAQARKIRHAFWVEVTFDRWVRRRMWKEAIKRTLFTRIDGVLTVGQDGRRFARHYHTSDDRIYYARHSVDVEHFAMGRKAALPQRDAIRSDLGLRGVTFIYVGRLWWGKGIQYLLDAFDLLQRKLQGSIEVSLLLLGDGADEASLRERVHRNGTRNVIFGGFRQKGLLPKYYAAADVFVFPTLGDPYGMVVDEAMACSLPVISTSEAGEIHERVQDGVNGFVVPAENSPALAEKMELLARDPLLRERMGQASFASIQPHTPERWAQDFELAIKKILEAAP